MPRSILLGRIPAKGEPYFLPDDTDGALEMARDDEMRCPRGHFLDETVGDEGPAIHLRTVVCEACAIEDQSKRARQKEMHSAGEAGDDLSDGVYTFAVVDPD